MSKQASAIMSPERKRYKATFIFNENRIDQVVRTEVIEAATKEEAQSLAADRACAIEEGEVRSCCRFHVDLEEA
jgi:hypothetical protein